MKWTLKRKTKEPQTTVPNMGFKVIDKIDKALNTLEKRR
jgi:hypothetical protein